jgi:hypothetical protein
LIPARCEEGDAVGDKVDKKMVPTAQAMGNLGTKVLGFISEKKNRSSPNWTKIKKFRKFGLVSTQNLNEI